MFFDLKKLIRNIGMALRGLRLAAQEQTFRIFCLVATVVIILMFWLKVSFYEKLILILVITLVMTLELINSRIERVLDIFQPNHDPRIKIIKDISAGAVLLSCLGAAIIGLLIFLPYIINLFD